MTATTMSLYAKLCARTLSRAHARPGDRIAIAAYRGRARCSIGRFATSPRPTRTRTSGITRSLRAPSDEGRVLAEVEI